MAKDEWGEVIQFLDGWCWGIAPDGQTVCCGREDAVRAMLADPNKRTGDEVVDGIIELERQLRKEKGEKTDDEYRARGTSGLGRTGVRSKRAKVAKVAKSGLRFSRHTSQRTRVSLR